MKKYGLHWRPTWPLMNPPNIIPFWGPEAMYNPLVKLNLQKVAKNLQKFYIFAVLRLLEAKPQRFSFLLLNPILKWCPLWKNFFDPRSSLEDMAGLVGNFQELFSHWSLGLLQIWLQYHWRHGVSFPKWYDTCILDEIWLHNWPKHLE